MKRIALRKEWDESEPETAHIKFRCKAICLKYKIILVLGQKWLDICLCWPRKAEEEIEKYLDLNPSS